MALLFFGLAGLNYFSAGNFISTDSLFFTTVAGMMALLFLLVPALSIRASKKSAKGAEAGGGTAASLPPSATTPQALRSGAVSTGGAVGASSPALKDARGRPVPPDVKKMMEQMKEPEAKSS
ncbi:MAG TPA: hypothetical protein VEV81_11790 [Pyrinomonadaceae bacterium]|nr:hypothetical protein [Pyrinomonadaceae bacterium]